LIATDGSELSVAAARRGCDVLGRPDHVTLLLVLTEMPGDDAGGFEGSVFSPEEQEALWRDELAEAADELDRTAAALAGAGAVVDKRIEVGEVAHTICAIAESLPADVVVVGSHGRSGLKRLFLGSVSEHVVRYAPCPVLVVREPHPPDGDA
jgi:nucleotide-binding universal stress UspA family protein